MAIRSVPALARLLVGGLTCALMATGCSSVTPEIGPTGPAATPATMPAATPASTPAPSTPAVSASPASTTTASATPSATASPRSEPDCSKLKCIALTYDDGPSPQTGRLLDTLQRERVTATLFMVGKAATANPAIVKRAASLGVEIGNHTTNHKQLNLQSDKVVSFEIADTQKRLKAITGQYPTWFRPPYAGRNKRTDAIAGRLKLGVVTWTTSPVDWENKDAATITRLVLSQARRNSIVLMHDSHSWTVNAAPAIIKGLKAKGYTLVTLTQLVGAPRPGRLYY